MTFAEHALKRVKALVMAKYADKPVSAQEREAYASEDWRKAAETHANAVAYYELLRMEWEAHKALLEGWRTMESSARSLAKI
jgi:hypothetical protein